MLIVVLFPNITNDIVPLLKCIGIWLEVSMLAPSLEVLDAFKTFGEAIYYTLDVVVGAGLHLQPVLLDVGNNRFVLNLNGSSLLSSLSAGFLSIFLFSLLRLKLKVANEVKVGILGVAARRQKEFFTDLFLNFVGGNLDLIVESQLHGKQGLTASLRRGGLSHGLIKIHGHYLLHIAVFIQGL